RHRLTHLSVDTDASAARAPHRPADVVIDVIYDGPDLTEVAQHTGLSVAQIINAHTATPWLVGFGGSTPGFAYLLGGDPRLQVPRRAELRAAVPAGSVALAGQFSGIYPRQWPGGWQVIGHTDAVLWDLERPHPALLTPGLSVQFRAA
uniref:5-oxoprolinase subunit B family protein n=1 Tax=Mycolicibacter arupensis TaxID=342002 RepID=UPI003B3A21CE